MYVKFKFPWPLGLGIDILIFECWCIILLLYCLQFQFSRQALPKFATGELRVTIDSTFSLEAATKAHERMRENKNIGKILITIKT